MVPVGAEPDHSAVSLDVTIRRPQGAGPFPALILAHGFGGSKESVATTAEQYAAAGYLVLAYTARGFGSSGGRIHLDDPDYEIADGRALVDLLAARPDVLKDGTDPRVGVAGGSYGGALALMLAGTDPRIDGVVASITWNDLAQSLFPESATAASTSGEDPTPPATPADVTPIASSGVFKQLWASRFFLAALAGGGRSGQGGGPSGPSGQGGSAPSASTPLLCGRFDPTICQGLLAASDTGVPTPQILATLRAHGPNATTGSRMPPTMLVQGQTDSLFGLDQADANARAIARTGAPLAVRWTDGGHDGLSTTAADDEAAARSWLDHYVKDRAPTTATLPVDGFTYTLPLARRQTVATIQRLPAYPGLPGAAASAAVSRAKISLLTVTKDALVISPPGGQPSSVTSLAGLLSGAAAGASSAGGAGGAAGGGGAGGGAAAVGALPTYPLAALPGQSTAITSRPLSQRITVAGTPTFTFSVTSSAPEVTLFASFWQVQGTTVSQPRPLVAPLHLTVTPGIPTEVTVALPAGVYVMEQGSQWRVLLTSTDSAFASPRTVRLDRLTLSSATLTVPTVAGTTIVVAGARDTESWLVGAALAAVILGLFGTAWWRRRQGKRHPYREDLAGTPLVVSNLVKTYADGHRAVDDVSWRAERGQVVGLLGPNGAGKTTTMRMMLGLIRPDSGTVHVNGHEITPGDPVLRNVGALVEGPGFLPHLTGRENLHAFWRATGRPEEEAGFEAAFDIAALGGALDRPARTYSHGMKQRLGIAQAMLGTPDVLFLDEPTNGLDPPQIAAMRPILQAYAATGRTVVVSSHLLAEVEMTCSHVVVMHAGRVVTSGPVAELVASEDTTVLETSSAPTREALEALGRADGIRSVDVIDESDRAMVTVVADTPRHDVVRAALDAGLEVVGVGSRRHLEEVFLGVIADASGATAAAAEAARAGGTDGGGPSLIERLRQVRAR